MENGTVFAGYPSSDLKSAIQTAGDVTQMQASVELVGTQFGVAPPSVPLPKNISLVTDGWKCPRATQRGIGYSFGLLYLGVITFTDIVFAMLKLK